MKQIKKLAVWAWSLTLQASEIQAEMYDDIRLGIPAQKGMRIG